MRLFRAWESFWGYLGYLRRNRRQRKASVAKRRDLRRRHRMDTLEQRVVLNADAVDDSLTTDYQSSVVIAASQLTDNDSYSGTPTLSLPSSTAYGGSLADNYDGTYTYTPTAGFSGTDYFSYTLSDEDPSSDSATVSISVGSSPPQNNAPYANDDNYTVYAPYGSGGVTINWADYAPDLGNDSDPDGNPLSIFANNNPNSWQWIGSGQSAGYTYTVDDGQGGQATATVTVQVEEEAAPTVNYGPTAVDDYYTLTIPYGSSPYYADLSGYQPDLGNDSDPENDGLSITSNDNPGWTNVSAGNSVSFGYTITDGQGNYSSATVYINIVEDAPPSQNNAPYANDVTFNHVIPYGSSNYNLDLSGDVPQTPGDYGDQEGTPSISYSNYGGTNVNPGEQLSYGYTVTDADGLSASATVYINIVEDAPPTNNAPYADNAVFELRVPYGSGGGYYELSGYIPQQGTHYDDPDGDGLTLTYGGYGWTYVSPGQQYSSSYSVDDGRGGVATATVFINIVEDYAPPSIPGGPYTINEDTTLSLQTTNPSGQPLSLSVLSGPTHGSLAVDAAGLIIYTPEANYFGTDSFTCTISDGQQTSTPATVTVEIQPIDDVPTAMPDSFTVAEDGSVSFMASDLLGNDSDPESGVTFVRIVQPPTNGTLSEWGSGSSTQFAYTPAANYCGGDSFVYEIVDGTGNLAQATVSINVTPVNDPPTAVGDDGGTMSEDGALVVWPSDWLGNDTDDEGAPTLESVSASAGTLVANGNGSYTFTPSENFQGTTSLIYTIADSQGLTGSAAVTITVTPVNDAPTATGGAHSITEGNSLMLSSHDVDGDALLSAQVSLGPSYGNVTFADGTLTYTPSDPDFFGSDAFEYAVFDGQEWSSTVHVDVTVEPVNDAPAISAPTAQLLTTTGGMLVFSVAGGNALAVGDVEVGAKRLTLAVDHGQLSYGAGTPAQSLIISGTVAQLNAALEGLRFHAPANYAGPAVLTITVDDQDTTGGGALSATASVALRVQPRITVADASGVEGSAEGKVRFTVNLTAAYDQPVTVDYQTLPSSASSTDFVSQSGTLTFAAGTTMQDLDVAILDDEIAEYTEGFLVAFSGATNAVIDTPSADGSITDNDPDPTVTVESVEVSETTGWAVVHFKLSHESEKNVYVNWSASDGTAVAPYDYGYYWNENHQESNTYTLYSMERSGTDVVTHYNYNAYDVYGTESGYWATSYWGAPVETPFIEPQFTTGAPDSTWINPQWGQHDTVEYGYWASSYWAPVEVPFPEAQFTTGTPDPSWVNPQWGSRPTVEYGYWASSYLEEGVEIPFAEPQFTTGTPDPSWVNPQWGPHDTVEYGYWASSYWSSVETPFAEPQFTTGTPDPSWINPQWGPHDTVEYGYWASSYWATTEVPFSEPQFTTGTPDPSWANPQPGTRPVFDHTEPAGSTTSGPSEAWVNGYTEWTEEFPYSDSLTTDSPSIYEAQGYHVVASWNHTEYFTVPAWEAYGETGGQVYFAPHSLDATAQIYIYDDGESEADETINIQLSSPSSAVLDSSSAGSVTIVDNETPQAPRAHDKTYEVVEDTPLTIDAANGLLAGAWDPNGQSFAISNFSSPTGGSVTIDANSGAFTYTPNADWSGPDSFTVDITDGSNQTTTITVTLNVAAVNDAPTITVPANLAAVVGTPLSLAATGIVIADVDADSSPLQVALTAAQGVVSIDVGQTGVIAVDTSGLWTLTGTAAQLNAFLAGQSEASISYLTDVTTAPTTDSLTLVVDDLGNSGSGGAKSTVAVIDVAITELTLPLLTAAYTPVSEGDASVTLTLTLSQPLTEDVTIAWNTADRTARAGIDYVAATNTLTFLAGQTTAQVTIGILNDSLDEDDKSFALELSGPESISIEESAVEVTISDDDASPTLTIVDTTADEAAGFAEFTVTLSAASDRVVFVDWATVDGTAGAGDLVADNGRLAFAPGETSRKIVVDLVNDDVHEATKNFAVNLSNPSNATIPGSTTATATITNDDAPPTISVVSSSVSENEEFATIVVELSRPSESIITVDWSAVDGTAHSPDDYVADTEHPLSGTLTFAPQVTQQSVVLSLVNDATEEDDETIAIELSNADVLYPTSDGTLTIHDDERIRVTIADQEFDESAGVVGLVVTLPSATTETVTVEWQIIDDTAVEGVDFELVKPRLDDENVVIENEWDLLTETDLRTLTFVPGEPAPVIYVRILDDAVFDGDRAFRVRLSNPTNANASTTDAEITILDDELVPGYLSDLGVTAANFATTFPRNAAASAATPTPQIPDTSVPSFPTTSDEFVIASRADAVRSVDEGVLKDLDAWQRDEIHVIPGTITTTSLHGRIEMAADGSFSFIPTLSEAVRNSPVNLDDSFQYELVRSDGSRVTKTADLKIRPTSPTISVSTPSPIKEGSEGELTVTIGANDGPVALYAGGPSLDDLELPLAEAGIRASLSFGSDGWSAVDYQPGSTAHVKIDAIDDRLMFGPMNGGSGVLPVYVVAVDSFWGTTKTVRQEVAIDNENPVLEITSMPTQVNEGEPFLVKGKITDAGAVDGFILTFEFQGNDYYYEFPNDTDVADAVSWRPYAWNASTREFVLSLGAGDDSPESDPEIPSTPYSNSIVFHLADDDGGTCATSSGLAVVNTPPRISFNLSEQRGDGSYDLGLAIEDAADAWEVDYEVFDEQNNLVSDNLDLGQISANVMNGWHGTITATDDDGAPVTRTFAIPGAIPASDPAPVYDVDFEAAMLELFNESDADQQFVNPSTLRVFARDAFSGADDGIQFVIESAGGSTSDPDHENLEVSYSIRKKLTSEELAQGVVGVTYAGSQATIDFNALTGPSWRPKWDSEIELVITSVERSVGDAFGNRTRTATTIPTTGTDKKASAWIHGLPAADSMDINLTQDPGRNPEAAATVGEGGVAVGVREGDVRLAFDPSGMSFTPTYVGAEQLYPVALVQTKLPVVGAVTQIKAKLIIAGGNIDPTQQNSTVENSDIVGGELTFDVAGTITDDNMLHFAVPLAGKDLNSLRSGRHDFFVVFTVTDYEGEHTLTQRGSFIWQNRFDADVGETEFGDGWAIPELSSLIYSPANGAGSFQGGIAGESGLALLNGDGTGEWFQIRNVGDVMTIPAVEDDSQWKLVNGELIAEAGGVVSWSVPALQAGKLYEVTVAWPTAPDLTTSATYEVVHGRAALAGRNPQTSFTLNQQLGGRYSLGLFTPDDSGLIEIKLSASGKVVAGGLAMSEVAVADASGQELRFDAHPGALDSGLRLQLSDSDGLLRRFDFSGSLRELRDLNDNRIAFGYYGDHEDDDEEFAGLLKTVTRQGGLTTTYTYSGRYLDKITDFADREIDYSITNEELKEIKGVSPGLGSQQPISEFDYGTDDLLKEIKRTVSTGTGGITQTTTIGRDGVFHRVTTVSISDTVTTASWSFTPIVAAAFYDDAHHIFAPADNHIGSDVEIGARKEVQATYVDTAGSTWIYQTDRLGYVTALAKPKVYAFDEATGTGFQYDAQHPENNVVALEDEVWTWYRDSFGKAFLSVQPTRDDDGVLRRQDTVYIYDGIQLASIQYYKPYDDTGIPELQASEDWEYENILDEWGTVIARKLKEHKAFFDVQAGEPSSARLITKYVADDRGNILKETGSDGSVTINQYTYKPHTINDLAGGLVDLTWDAVHGTTDYVYYGQSSTSLTDEERRRISLVKQVTYAKGLSEEAKESFTYDDNRNLDKQTDAYGIETDYDYDNLDRLAKTTHAYTADAPSLVESAVFDGLGNVVREIQESGYVDPTSDLAPFIRTFQYETSYIYDVLDRVKKIHDEERNDDTEYAYVNIAGGQQVTLKTSKPGEPANQITTHQVTTELYYDARGQLTATVHPESTYFVYDPDNDIWKIFGLVAPSEVETDTAREKVVDFATYDQQGNIATSWSAVQTEIAPDDRKTTYEYDALGRQWKITGPDPDAELSSTLQNLPQSRPLTEYVYAADGSLLQTKSGSVDASGYRTLESRRYDGGRTEVDEIIFRGDGTEDKNYFQAYREYDAGGRLIVQYDANINATHYAYDHLDRLISVRDAAGGVTTIDYFTRSQALNEPHEGVVIDERAVHIERVTQPPANDSDSYPRVTWKQYDSAGNLIRIVNPDPDGEQSTLKANSDVYLYNADGTLAQQWQEYGTDFSKQRRKSFEYDEAGRLTRVYDALGDLATYAYDRLDTVIRQSNGRGGELRIAYDELGRKTSEAIYDLATGQVVPGTRPTIYLYDHLDHVSYTADQYGDVTVKVQDALGRTVGTYEPDRSFDNGSNPNRYLRKEFKNWFDDHGNLRQVTAPMGQDTQYSDFDAWGRARRVFENNVGVAGTTKRYEFNAVGNVTKVTDVVEGVDKNVIDYEYDALNRVHKERIVVEGETLESTWTYNLDGSLKSYRDRDGRVSNYTYDALGRKIEEYSYNPSSQPYGKTLFTYNKAGDLESAQTYSFAGSKYVLVSNYAYMDHDERGRAKTVTEQITALGADVKVTFRYEYDDELAGNARRSPAARTASSVAIADASGRFLYRNTYQFDSIGREVFAEQDLMRDRNDKQITHEYFSGANAAAPDPADAAQTPYADRREVVTRSQRVNGQYQAISKTRTYYEAQDSQLVRRIEHLNGIDQPLTTFFGAVIGHQYNYDSAGRLRRYVDRTDDEPQKIGDTPFITTDDRFEFSRVNELKNPQETVVRGGIHYDRQGHVDGFTNYEGVDDNYTIIWGSNDQIVKLTEDWTDTLFYYDAFGRLVAKGVDGNAEIYVYEGAEEAFRLNAAGGLISRSFYSAGQLAAVDVGSSLFGAYSLWALNDAQGTVRDLAELDGNSVELAYKLDYGGTGLPDVSINTPEAAIRYHGQAYVQELSGYYNGAQWSSSLLDGRTLSVTSLVGPNRYGNRDPSRPEEFNPDWIDQADRFFAGYASALTVGYSDDFRAWKWGETATRNHQGWGYTIGFGAGLAVGTGLSFGTLTAVQAGTRAALAVRAATGYTVLAGAASAFRSTQALIQGNFQWTDALGFLPVATWGTGRILKNAIAAKKVAPSNVTVRALSTADEAEVAAQRALTDLQGRIQYSHFLTRHSPLMTQQELLQRATGIVNKAGKLVKSDASRFLSYVDMKLAIDKATAAYKVAGITGVKPIVIDMLRPIGEGYLKGGGALMTTTKIQASFDEYGQLITIFPKLR